MASNENINNTKKTSNKYLQYLMTIEGQRMLIMVITIFLITLILCSRYFSFNSVITNGVSNQTIIAHKSVEVIDEDATNNKRLEVVAKVKPVLKPADGNVDEVLHTRLLTIEGLISELRDKILNKEIKSSDIDDFLKNTELKNIDKSLLKYLLYDTTDDSWQNIIVKESDKILNSILTRQITEEDLQEGKLDLIRSYLKRSISESNGKAIVTLVDIAIDQPNYVIDVYATNAAKKIKMESFEPIMVQFKKDHLVVSKGQRLALKHYEALKKLGYTVDKAEWFVMIGIMCFVVIAVNILWYYISRYEPKYANQPRYLALLATLAVISFLILRLIPHFSKVFHFDIPVYAFPLAAVTLIIAFFINYRISLMFTTMILFLIAVVFQFPVESLAVLVFGVMFAMLKTSKMSYYRDFSLIECGITVALAQIVVVLCNYLISNNVFGDAYLSDLFIKCSIALASGILTGALTIMALPYFEATFGIITSHGLMELSDHNQPLLRQLQFEAPGTYHHSLMVSTLAEAAAEAIGASTILVRVGAFYHDIGKLKRPSYFIENQTYLGVENPHDKLNPKLSKMVLIAHVKDGLELAKQYKLPKPILNMISEHHGDGVMLYFYRTALENKGDENISKEQFRYTNPRPSSKESAIIMLADATESAVRSLKNPSVTAVEEMVMRIIKERLDDDQLADSPLTLNDIKIISQTFIRILKGMQHHRIEYHETMLEELGRKHSEASKNKSDKPINPNIKTDDSVSQSKKQ